MKQRAVITTSFENDIASINAFFGFPDGKTETWQKTPLKCKYSGVEVWCIVYLPKLQAWCDANNREVVKVDVIYE